MKMQEYKPEIHKNRCGTAKNICIIVSPELYCKKNLKKRRRIWQKKNWKCSPRKNG